MALEALESSPVKKSLLVQMTTFGVDDWLFVINLEVTLVIVMLLKIHFWAYIAIGLHFVLMMVTGMRPRLLEIYVKYMRQASRYWPGDSPLQKRGHVPSKFKGWA